MLFGMPTLIETETAQESAALCRELGLDFVELNMNMPQYQLNALHEDDLIGLAENYGIFFTVHLDENLNVSDFNPYVAEAYLRTVRETIAFAKNIGAPIINMHLAQGVYFTLPNEKRYLFEEYKERYLQSMGDLVSLCENAIGDSKIRICVENCDGFHDFQKEAIAMLLESPCFALTYDVGHNHSCGGRDEGYILENKDSLCHMHLHDALGRKNHLALGSGELELDRLLALASERDCRVVLETKTVEALKSSVSWLRARGYMSNI